MRSTFLVFHFDVVIIPNPDFLQLKVTNFEGTMLMCLQEAKQAVELMGRWQTIDVCDALELLSPVFESEEVGTTDICMHV